MSSIIKEKKMMNGGCYTVAHGYEFYVRVARTISHEGAHRISELLLLPLEHKIYIFELTCSFLFIISIIDIQGKD